jgi:hypothetical protein
MKPRDKRQSRKSSTVTAMEDNFWGQIAAFFSCSPAGEVIKNSFGNKWTNDALCFMLDATHGHIVGKVMRQSRWQSGINTYDIAWECTALGETQVDSSFIRDACIAGC